jgi:23S rRNA maturation mini-RNase III
VLQAACYNLLLAEGWPSADEASLMRWAANSNVVSPPKHANRQLYKQATALEALVGV